MSLNWPSYVDTTAPVEHDRLTLLQEVFDPRTARLLDQAGVGPGWDCLEVGAGAGSVARMLAERAGPAHVTATDMSIDFLTPLADLGVRVLRHDVTRDEAPGRFDLIHTRLVLEHVTERDIALRRLASWLKPGGVLLVECATPVPEVTGDPAVARTLAAMAAVLGRTVGTDSGWARTMPLPLERAGLVDCTAEGLAVAVRGGSPMARWLAETCRLTQDTAVAEGLASTAEYEAAYAAYADPAYVDYSWLSVAAVGRSARV
ncbi:MAG TPA: class I SAM-dependent methyltransferase [Actinophytocola sp.]|nr:class I SAM-dependent methyltransferase [Actinophytocola sp.]